ncbi:MAG: sugar transferase [Oscillochloridaceae bacterium]|nr:sugar transferase [Chloroflexaceae bacterium]MDW8391894.1 sugar transferase [Oscillochloridaceae bacterium]
MGKRLFDVLCAGLGLALTWPLILAGAIAVRLSSPGPIFYRARRAGRNGVPFTMYKLRTMRTGLDHPNRRVTEANDDRITPVGKWLRRFRIDELPQLWNVLRGDMSIIGPRPEDYEIVQRHYTSEQRRTLSVRPGLAAPSDVRWYPDFTYHDPPPPGVPLQEYYIARHLPARLAWDLRYIERQSLLLDLQIIAQVLFCILVYSWAPPPRRPVTADLLTSE